MKRASRMPASGSLGEIQVPTAGGRMGCGDCVAPLVGATVATPVGVGVALVSEGLTTGLLALALIVGVQQLEGNVIAPYVLGRELHVHPLVVVVSVTAGAAVLWPFGALVGVRHQHHDVGLTQEGDGGVVVAGLPAVHDQIVFRLQRLHPDVAMRRAG